MSSQPPAGITVAQARAAEVGMKMRAQEDTLAQKRLIVRCVLTCMVAMVATTIYVAIFKKDVVTAVSFAAVDTTLGFTIKAISSHFFPSWPQSEESK